MHPGLPISTPLVRGGDRSRSVLVCEDLIFFSVCMYSRCMHAEWQQTTAEFGRGGPWTPLDN